MNQEEGCLLFELHQVGHPELPLQKLSSGQKI
jgi:hypothetical protein